MRNHKLLRFLRLDRLIEFLESIGKIARGAVTLENNNYNFGDFHSKTDPDKIFLREISTPGLSYIKNLTKAQLISKNAEGEWVYLTSLGFV